MTDLLTLVDVEKRYANKTRSVKALRPTNLAVAAGEFVTIVGPSGCGKTTLLRIVGGLLKASGGDAFVAGTPVLAPRSDVGFVFQQDSLLPWRDVTDNVTLGLELARVPRGDARRRVQPLIQKVGLGGFEAASPNELSGGMRQRVNLARALAIDPDLLLMDEPFASLDAQTREFMQLELLRLCGSGLKTVLFITHQIDEAIFLSDRVLVMSARPGSIKADISIRLARPRNLNQKRTVEFLEYERAIWDHLGAEAATAFGETA